MYSTTSVCYTVVPTDANKSKDTIKNLAPDITKAFWHCWQTICTKVLAGSEPSYQWQLYAASITDPLCNRVFVNFHNNLVYSLKSAWKIVLKKSVETPLVHINLHLGEINYSSSWSPISAFKTLFISFVYFRRSLLRVFLIHLKYILFHK